MALEIQAPTKSATGMPRRAGRASVDHGPNLFLDNGWLLQSYETGEPYEVPVEGEFIQDTIKKGARKGEPTERLTGDAAEVVRQLREAANELNIGVAIKYYEVLNKNKTVKKGWVLVKYQGVARKQRQSKTNGTQPEATEADQGYDFNAVREAVEGFQTPEPDFGE